MIRRSQNDDGSTILFQNRISYEHLFEQLWKQTTNVLYSDTSIANNWIQSKTRKVYFLFHRSRNLAPQQRIILFNLDTVIKYKNYSSINREQTVKHNIQRLRLMRATSTECHETYCLEDGIICIWLRIPI